MIKNNKLAVLIGIVFLFTVLILALINMDKTNVTYWYKDYTRVNQPYTLLLGSSSILRMPLDLLTECENPVIYGFNNGTTESIDGYLQFANLDNAIQVILYIGENDIAQGEKPEITFSQLKKIIKKIESKYKGKIGIVKLKYSPARSVSHIDILAFNRLLSTEFSDAGSIVLIPFDEISDSTWFISDGIHLNQAGNTKFSRKISDFCSI